VTRGAVGRCRDEVRQVWQEVPIGAREKRLSDGLLKLIDDACEYATESPCDPVDLRSDVFLRASAARRDQGIESPFDRNAVLAAVAAERGLDVAVIERTLYADLRGEHVLTRVEPLSAAALVDRYNRGQVQAVLLRALRVVADVRCSGPERYRDLFRQLKFRRLLHRITARPEGGFRVEIDGPYSLFDSVTKYGLQLALVLPALEACDSLSLAAEVRWGKARDALTFSHRTEGATGPSVGSDRPSEVESLMEAFRALETAWSVDPAEEILELPGLGLCVPDLVFRRADGARVLFEALGFWSRDAVWRRVELAERGLPEPVLFAVSSRLRVSEAVLDDVEHAALYVYKGSMSARAIASRLDALVRGA
jgi:predicted nuclease of restriction endonuclease-like RecB superfamily